MKTTMETPKASELDGIPHWRLKGIGLLRILFGIIWGVDAWFKWQPGFINGFAGYLSGAQDGQPLLLHHWIVFWANTVGIDPTLFAYATAVAEDCHHDRAVRGRVHEPDVCCWHLPLSRNLDDC